MLPGIHKRKALETRWLNASSRAGQQRIIPKNECPSGGQNFRRSNVDGQIMVGNIYQDGSTIGTVIKVCPAGASRQLTYPSANRLGALDRQEQKE